MSEIQNIQWFPGHMAKTRRMIKSSLRLVDAVVEIVDARIPQSSRNPEIDGLTAGKPRMLLLNKCDMADPSQTAKWLKYYKSIGYSAIAADCRSGNGLKNFAPAVREMLSELLERRAARGMKARPVQLMIVGIPNVGKSSLINRLAGRKKAKVEDRPGVTRSEQWVTVDKDMELLDMPGVLWPKFEDKAAGENLAFTGAVRDDVMDTEHLAIRLIERLTLDYADKLSERFSIEITESEDGHILLEKIARKRGMLMAGGEINVERASAAVLDEFRAAKIGRITLEHCMEL